MTESTAGAWYRRGSLQIFVERSRIDHIEREELEALGRIRFYFQEGDRLDDGKRKTRQFDKAERREVWRRSLFDLLRDGAGVTFQLAGFVTQRRARPDAIDAGNERATWR